MYDSGTSSAMCTYSKSFVHKIFWEEAGWGSSGFQRCWFKCDEPPTVALLMRMDSELGMTTPNEMNDRNVTITELDGSDPMPAVTNQGTRIAILSGTCRRLTTNDRGSACTSLLSRLH